MQRGIQSLPRGTCVIVWSAYTTALPVDAIAGRMDCSACKRRAAGWSGERRCRRVDAVRVWAGAVWVGCRGKAIDTVEIGGLWPFACCCHGHLVSASVIITLPACVRTLGWREDRVRPRLATLASYISRVQCAT